MSEQWILRLKLQHSHGIRAYEREMAVPVEIDIESPRAVDELKAGLATMTGAVAIMKRRNIRREQVRAIAQQLAEQLCDTIEDAAGWHGADRQEGVKDAGLARGINRH